MTIQGMLKCICHRHSQLIWRAASKAVVQLSRGASAQQGRGISPHFAELDPTSAAPWLWRSQMALMKIMGRSSSYAAPQLVYMAKAWEMLLRGRADPRPQSSMKFYLFKICLIFSKQVLTADWIYKAWLFQQTTSGLHRYFVINLCIWKKKKIPLIIDSGLILQKTASGTGDNPGTESWEKHVLCDMMLWHEPCVSHSYKVQICPCASSNPGCTTGTLFSQTYG